jgi:putative membrane protein
MTFIRNVLVLAAGVLLATLIVPGIDFEKNWGALALVVLILALFNAVIKPILVFFTLPFIFLSLGIGLWLINALLLYWAAHLVEDFHVSSFWAALGGAFVISITSMMLSGFRRVPRPRHGQNPPTPPSSPNSSSGSNGEVIDV